jgi:UDP-glucose 4-epimerase
MDQKQAVNGLEGASCLVTGGAGFVGSTIVDQLLNAGVAEVRIFDNFVRGSRGNIARAVRRPGVSVLEGDIRDADLVDQATEGVSYIFHQAALRITRCAEVPREAMQVLIEGTFNVAEAALRHKVRKLVVASSASVYGEPSYLPIDEGHPFNNTTMYGACKIATEQILRALHNTSGLPYVALRPFNVYGPRMDMAGVYTEVLIRWLDAIDEDAPPLIFGDGKQSMDFVYVEDVARANLLAATSGIVDDVFNVGSGTQTSLYELCMLLLQLCGSRQVPEYRTARSVGNVQRRRAMVDKAEKLLGFKTSVSLTQGLEELILWRESAKEASAMAVKQ